MKAKFECKLTAVIDLTEDLLEEYPSIEALLEDYTIEFKEDFAYFVDLCEQPFTLTATLIKDE